MDFLKNFFSKKDWLITNSQIRALAWIIILGDIMRLREGTIRLRSGGEITIPKGTNVSEQDYGGAIRVALKIYQMKKGNSPTSTTLSASDVSRESDLLYKLCKLYATSENPAQFPDLTNQRLLSVIDQMEEKLHTFFERCQISRDWLDMNAFKEHLNCASYPEGSKWLRQLRKEVDPEYRRMMEGSLSASK